MLGVLGRGAEVLEVRRGQLSPVRLLVLAMLVLSIAVILLLILRPNLIGLSETANSTVFESFKGIGDIIGDTQTDP